MSEAIDTVADSDERLLERLDFAFAIFLRLLSAVFLVFTLLTWSWAVGYSDAPQIRFDTMTAQTRIYVAVLAVLHPVTCVGLWTTLPWGRVVWMMAIAFQLGFLFTNPGAFGDPRWLAVFHLGCVAIYVIFQFFMQRVANKE